MFLFTLPKERCRLRATGVQREEEVILDGTLEGEHIPSPSLALREALTLCRYYVQGQICAQLQGRKEI